MKAETRCLPGGEGKREDLPSQPYPEHPLQPLPRWEGDPSVPGLLVVLALEEP